MLFGSHLGSVGYLAHRLFFSKLVLINLFLISNQLTLVTSIYLLPLSIIQCSPAYIFALFFFSLGGGGVGIHTLVFATKIWNNFLLLSLPMKSSLVQMTLYPRDCH